MSKSIVICGSHSVGKTTIAKLLQDKLGLAILPDVARIAHAKGMPINEHTTLWSHAWMIGEQTFLENNSKTAGFVGDKCLWDYYVYGKVIFGKEVEPFLKVLAHPSVQTYDIGLN